MKETAPVLIFILLLLLLFVVVIPKMTDYNKKNKALESPYRDKKLYYDLLKAKSRLNGLLFAFIVFGMIYVYQDNKIQPRANYRPPEPCVPDTIPPAAQPEFEHSTFIGGKEVESKGISTGDAHFDD